MKNLIFTILIVLLFTISCTREAAEGYWKVTFTADVYVKNDGSIPDEGGGPIACFSIGYIGAVLYFPIDGGELVSQKSFVTIDSVYCIHCISQIVSPATNIPIELSARLDVHGVTIGNEAGEATTVIDDFRIWMDSPVVFPIDIYYNCGSTPGTMSDFGNAVSQLTSPFLTQVWSFSPTFGELHTSTFEGYNFPPSYTSDLTFSILEEYVKEIDFEN